MSLCQLDGKIYSETMYDVILKNKNKQLECKCCAMCWGLFNTKYELGSEKNIFVIPENVVLKVYKISSSTFEYKPEKNKPESKILTDILKNAKKKYKDLLQ